jgi:hypothetical protein
MMPTKGNARLQPGADTSDNYTNDTADAYIKQSAKRLIVRAAVWGLIPSNFASWLLLLLGLISE